MTDNITDFYFLMYKYQYARGAHMLKYKQISYIFWLIIFCLAVTSLSAKVPTWYEAYQAGLTAMKENSWKTAISHFEKAIQEKASDSKKQRAFGTIFVEYYPHRELGICYYYLNDLENANGELSISLEQSSSKRAKVFLQKIKASDISVLEKEDSGAGALVFAEKNVKETETVENFGSEIIGDRLSIAVLPFESKGLGDELGSIDLLDKLITGFVNINRFKVIERALLERILQEQKLAMSGVIDASTAAEIGKGIGVDLGGRRIIKNFRILWKSQSCINLYLISSR
jgi:tetratricopeptide (TPR) repeat protein